LSQKQVVFQSLLADFCFATVIWVITMIIGFILYGGQLFSLNGVLWGLNLFIFSLVSLAISFLIGSLIKTKSSIPAIANTIGLGFSFLCGAFVPQNLLGDGVLTVAKFIPTYWYIRANNLIGTLNTLSGEQLGPILICYIIQVGFFVAIIAISLVINKQRRVESFA
jgi:ABC-2 type transport system permease protein